MLTAIPNKIIVPIFQPAQELEVVLAPFLKPLPAPRVIRWQYRTGYPHIGLMIVTDYIDAFLDTKMDWVQNPKPFHERLMQYLHQDVVSSQIHVVPAHELKHFSLPHLVRDHVEIHLDESKLIWCEEVVHTYMLSIVNDLLEFIGRDTWNIYTTKRVGLDLAIEKGEDYRIREWMLLKKQGKI